MARSPKPLRRPEELRLPAERSRVEAILSTLPQPLIARFIPEVVGAVERARREGDLRPLNDCIETWYRTALLLNDPDYEAALERARSAEASEEPFDLPEALAILGVDRGDVEQS